MKAVLILSAIFVPLAFLAHRPAFILGIEPGALAHSVGGYAPHGPTCNKEGDDLGSHEGNPPAPNGRLPRQDLAAAALRRRAAGLGASLAAAVLRRPG